MRVRGLTGLLAAAAVLAPAQAAPAASFRAHLSAPTHHPRACHRWKITVTARTASGRALRATAVYKFLFQGQVVSTQYPSPRSRASCTSAARRHSPWPFTGRFTDSTIMWPRRSVGIPLTFRVVVRVAHRGTKNLDYRVRVRR
jgi:hypothetical protein